MTLVELLPLPLKACHSGHRSHPSDDRRDRVSTPRNRRDPALRFLSGRMMSAAPATLRTNAVMPRWRVPSTPIPRRAPVELSYATESLRNHCLAGTDPTWDAQEQPLLLAALADLRAARCLDDAPLTLLEENATSVTIGVRGTALVIEASIGHLRGPAAAGRTVRRSGRLQLTAITRRSR